MTTTKATHTPGPWHIRWVTGTESERAIADIQHGEDTGRFAVSRQICSNVRGEANARLIAAAPSLLEAAVAALRFMEAVEANTGQGWTTESFVQGVRDAWHAAYVPIQLAIASAT